MKLTILLPCLNEAETIATCVEKSIISLNRLKVTGEVLVVDNGSTDGSQQIAVSAGARVVESDVKGYGAALIKGIADAKSEFVIMGDSDDSYALDELSLFLSSLEAGSDLVIGNRFAGGIHPGAMPWLHKYLGNPVLSWIGRLFFKISIGDFHCGLRGFKLSKVRDLNLRSTGMEFASEMIVKASLSGFKIDEVPTTLMPDGRSRPPHLRTWRDGWRHLIFLLAASPRWLFLYPGAFLFLIGCLGMLATIRGPISIIGLEFSLNSFFIFIGLALAGIQTLYFGILARIFSSNYGILPKTSSITRFESKFTLERGIALGLFLITSSIALSVLLLSFWSGNSIDGVDEASALKLSGLIVLISSFGIQTLFASFFASILQTD
jgi:glycosyltransferase involved in cell wall biosynthesis